MAGAAAAGAPAARVAGSVLAVLSSSLVIATFPFINTPKLPAVFHKSVAGGVATAALWIAASTTLQDVTAKAVEALEAGKVGRIVLSRPAVEAGESIGFLPGDMEDKLAPYLRPLYDALSDRLSMKRVRALIAEGAIEIAPVGYMRGRTLNNAFIVVDEAQNCTYVQLKMLLTRLGWHSTASMQAPANTAANGCAPPMPPSPPVRIQRPRRSPPKCWRPASAKVS